MTKFSTQSDTRYQIVLQIFQSIYCFAESSLNVLLKHSIAQYSQGRARCLPSTPDGCEEFIASPKGSLEARNLGLHALVLEDQGWYRDAEQNYEKAFDSLRISPGPDHGITLFCQNKLASMLRHRCDYDKAVSLSKQCVEERIRISGTGALPTLLSAGTLTMALEYQGNHYSAYSLIRDALENADTTMSLPTLIPYAYLSNILADLVQECGMYDLAEALYYYVVRLAIDLYGGSHPYTLNRLSDMALMIALQGNMSGAEAMTRRALDGLEEALGTDHPHCLRSAQRLADYVRYQKRYGEASARLKGILSIQEIRPGPDHPDTLSTKSSLGAVYAQEGYLIDAARLLDEAYTGQKSRLPPKHSDMMWTYHALAGLRALKENSTKRSDEERHPELLDFLGPKSNSAARSDIQRNRHCDSAFWTKVENQVISAAMEGNQIRTRELINEHIANEADPSRIIGRAFREAAANSHRGLIISLLEIGANIDSIGGFHGTALQAASFAGSDVIVQLLLDREANVNIRGGVLDNALRAAIVGHHPNIACLLLKHSPEQEVLDSSIASAIATRQQEILLHLLQKGANPNARDSIFGTPLQQAAFTGQHEIVSLLLQHGAEVNSSAGLIGSPLHAAMATRHIRIVKQLRAAGADLPSQKSSFGFQAFGGHILGDEALLTEILLEYRSNAVKPEAQPPADRLTDDNSAPIGAERTLDFAPATNRGPQPHGLVNQVPHKRTKSSLSIGSKASRASQRSLKALQRLMKRTNQWSIKPVKRRSVKHAQSSRGPEDGVM